MAWIPTLYGLDRLAQQQGSTSEYYLGDALGSVRQIVNSGGIVALTRSYDPYGNTRYSVGDAQTNFGFTGEFVDPSGMIYLRARYYDSLTGRFTSRDTWGVMPMSLCTTNNTMVGLSFYDDRRCPGVAFIR